MKDQETRKYDPNLREKLLEQGHNPYIISGIYFCYYTKQPITINREVSFTEPSQTK